MEEIHSTGPATGSPFIGTERLSLELQNLQRIDEAVDRADSKSAIIATANVGLLTILLGLATLLFEMGRASFKPWQIITIIVAFAVHFLPSVFSTLLAIDALFPRLNHRSQSIYYFGRLSTYGGLEPLMERFEQATLADYFTAIRDQIYRCAMIAQTKYQRLRWSVRFLYFSGAAWMILMVLLFVFLVMNSAA